MDCDRGRGRGGLDASGGSGIQVSRPARHHLSENQKAAGVVVDVDYAAATGFGKAAELRLTTCSRWPERRNCGQECLTQIQSSPEDCLVRNILVNWYGGKVCASCGQTFAEIEWSRKPALLIRRGSLEWSQFRR